MDVGRRWRAWRRRGERERWWRGLGVGVLYGQRGEGEVDMGGGGARGGARGSGSGGSGVPGGPGGTGGAGAARVGG